MQKRNFRTLGFLVALAGLVGCSNPQNAGFNSHSLHSAGERIIGGTESTGTEEFASTVVGLYELTQGALCTASIIADNFLVTAAHCVDGANASSIRIIFGTNFDSQDALIASIDDYIVSPIWAARQNEELNTGDIAIIRFSSGLPEGFKPATLLTDLTQLANDQTTLLAGYGISDGVEQTGSSVLRFVETTIRDAKYTKTEVLIDQSKGKGACHGDSGGPAYLKVGDQLLLWGVTSRGVDDPNNDCSVAAAYTSIPFYARWIEKAKATLNDRANRTRPALPFLESRLAAAASF